jgi:hypothetical protein
MRQELRKVANENDEYDEEDDQMDVILKGYRNTR